MKNASLTTPTLKMLTVGLSLSCSLAYAGTEGYLSTSTAAGYSEVGPTAVYAGQGSVQDSISAREAARRHQAQLAAMQLIQEGRTAYQEGKYSEALDKYRQAWDRVPHAPATREMQEFIRKSISDASIAVAMEYAKVGRYDDAEQLLLDVLNRDPNNSRARKELALLRDPVRNNPALTPEHVKDVDEVNRLLNLAYGYYQLGRYDAADAEFANVLKIDPYNTAANRGREAVARRRMQYYRSAYDSYRARAIAEVDAMWNEVEPTYVETASVQTGSGADKQPLDEQQIKIADALNSIRVTQANFDNTPITDVVAFMLGEIRKSGAGHINVNYVRPAQADAPAAPVAAAASSSDDEEEEEGEEEEASAPAPARTVSAQPYKEPLVTVDLQNVTLRELLNEVCSQAGCVPVVRGTGVYIYTKGDPNAVDLVRRTWYDVPFEYLEGGSGDEEDDGGDDEDDAFTPGGKSAKGKKNPMDALAKNANVSWSPKGSFATYNKRAQSLTVYNTPEAIEAVDELITASRDAEIPMIKVTTKFVEVTQSNDEELSFDWIVNPFSVSNNGATYLGGATGSGASTNRTYEDFVTSGGSAYSNYHRNDGTWPVSNNANYASSSDPIRNGLVTGGLRSGNGAIASSTMDALLSAGSPVSSANASPAPGILSLSGIYNEGTFQMIMRGLSQKKGADVMSAPSLVITPGAEVQQGPMDELLGSNAIEAEGARIEVVRRFVFPTEYEKPEIPQNTPGSYGQNSTASVPVAAPANPQTWGVEEVGLVMVVKVDERPTNNIIKFNTFIVRVVDFEGFINYGSPIISGVANQNAIETIVLTENRIDQPVFSRKMVNTVLSIYDGHTVAIGGLVEDKVQKVEDKVPVFGDLPLIGRFFRSNAEAHSRKNLTIFVTADVIDAMGRPVRSRSGEQAPGSGAGEPGLFPEDGLVP